MNWMDSLVAELALLIEQRDVARADADALAEALRWLFPNHDALTHHDALVAKR
jgi:hypothetical protein